MEINTITNPQTLPSPEKVDMVKSLEQELIKKTNEFDFQLTVFFEKQKIQAELLEKVLQFSKDKILSDLELNTQLELIKITDSIAFLKKILIALNSEIGLLIYNCNLNVDNTSLLKSQTEFAKKYANEFLISLIDFMDLPPSVIKTPKNIRKREICEIRALLVYIIHTYYPHDFTQYDLCFILDNENPLERSAISYYLKKVKDLIQIRDKKTLTFLLKAKSFVFKYEFKPTQ